MDKKQAEALRIAEWLEGIRGNTWPSYIPQEAAAELRRLHSDYETLCCKLQTLEEELVAAGGYVQLLRLGYVAARQEIASLKAQPYDQQAMGLCHVCGWKGVIDYPDGPVCVACEHDKTLSPQPAAPAQVVPAPGVDAVSEREFKQFLSDVLTAAGLVTHGKKCKDLGRRLGEMSMRLLTAPKTAAAPVQALDAARVFWQQHTQADALSMTMAELHTDVELVIRAARGDAQAAPVDAAVKPAINVGTIGHVGSGRTTLTAALGKLIAAQEGNHD